MRWSRGREEFNIEETEKRFHQAFYRSNAYVCGGTSWNVSEPKNLEIKVITSILALLLRPGEA